MNNLTRFGVLLSCTFLFGCVTLKNVTERKSPVADDDQSGDISDNSDYLKVPYTLPAVEKIRRYFVDNPGYHFLLTTRPRGARNVVAKIGFDGGWTFMQKLISTQDPLNTTSTTLWAYTVPFDTYCRAEIGFYYTVSYKRLLLGNKVRHLGSQADPLKTAVRAYGDLLMYSVGDVNPPPEQWKESLSAWSVTPFGRGVSYAGMYLFSDIADEVNTFDVNTRDQLVEREFHLVNMTEGKEYTVLGVSTTLAPTVNVTFLNGQQETFPNKAARFRITEVTGLPATIGCGESAVFKVRYTRAPNDATVNGDFARMDIALREEGLPPDTYDRRSMFFIVVGSTPFSPG